MHGLNETQSLVVPLLCQGDYILGTPGVIFGHMQPLLDWLITFLCMQSTHMSNPIPMECRLCQNLCADHFGGLSNDNVNLEV